MRDRRSHWTTFHIPLKFDDYIMRHRTIALIIALALVANCGDIAGSRVIVEGAGPDEFLKLRAGPGLGFSVILGLPDGTSLNRGDCVTELGQLWCRVSLTAAPQITGYVSADYILAP
jgi:uncharacterized protein YraI